MNLIALTHLSLKLEGDLTGGLLCRHDGVNGQQSKTRQTGNRAFYAIGVADGLP